jgi:tetratricopeptide (TPR) repeat protein
MKNLVFIMLALVGLCLSGCQDPGKSRLYMDKGVKLMLNQSKFDEAEEAFDKAIKYDKSNYEAYYHRGCLKVNMKKYGEAIADFEQAIELKPDYADAYFNIGRTYILLNDEDKACEYYKLAQQYGRPNLEDYLRRCH